MNKQEFLIKDSKAIERAKRYGASRLGAGQYYAKGLNEAVHFVQYNSDAKCWHVFKDGIIQKFSDGQFRYFQGAMNYAKTI